MGLEMMQEISDSLIKVNVKMIIYYLKPLPSFELMVCTNNWFHWVGTYNTVFPPNYTHRFI